MCLCRPPALAREPSYRLLQTEIWRGRFKAEGGRYADQGPESPGPSGENQSRGA